MYPTTSFVESPIEDFLSLEPFFRRQSFHLAIAAVLDGAAVGRVWVDQVFAPRTAVLQTGHRFYVGGEYQEKAQLLHLADFFSNLAVGGSGLPAIPSLMLYPPEDWLDPLIQNGIPGADLYPGAREYYRITLPPGKLPVQELPEGFTIRRVDAGLLDQPNLHHRDVLIEEMLSERASPADFLQRSFGVCLLRDQSVEGWCLSEYNLGERCEVGIATAEAYQRRGLATAQGAAFLRLATRRGIREVGWHCWRKNQASGATARKLGLVKHVDYHGIYVQARGGPR